ncbi:MAG: Fur family transcriptional regulator [bacterium]|nr:Fur family transcriptional regulator [bacterium]
MQEKYCSWEEKLKSSGGRLTTPRKIIFYILSSTPKHLSAEDIYFIIHKKNPKVGLTTIYRTLDVLVKIGFLNKFDFGDGHSRYELIEAPNKQHHHHLICRKCSKILDYTDFIEEEIKLVKATEKALSRKYKFEIKDHVFQFYGVCDKCKK